MKGSEKINKVLAQVGLRPSEFAKAIRLKAPQNVYDIQKDKIDISRDVALKIVEVYPEFDILWLLTGKGPMLKEGSSSAGESRRESDVVIPADVWQVIKDQAASLKTKDEQISEVIVLLKEQIKKGESLAGGHGHAAQGEAALG